MDYRAFGNTGLTVSVLAFGTGTHGWGGRSEQTGLGIDGLTRLLRSAFELGINFWDAADAYGSHQHIARALQGVQRDRVVIATKTTAQSASQATRDVERFLRELRTEFLDIVLLHCMTRADWTGTHAEAMEALSKSKEQGKVRAVGVSCHSLGALRTALETEWAQVVLVRINMAGVHMDAPPSEVAPLLGKLYASGKAIYAMKVLGCGQLAHNPRGAIDYVLRLGTVHSIVIGMSSYEQLLANVSTVGELTSRQKSQQ